MMDNTFFFKQTNKNHSIIKILEKKKKLLHEDLAHICCVTVSKLLSVSTIEDCDRSSLSVSYIRPRVKS